MTGEVVGAGDGDCLEEGTLGVGEPSKPTRMERNMVASWLSGKFSTLSFSMQNASRDGFDASPAR
jgi:hypothetical protein